MPNEPHVKANPTPFIYEKEIFANGIKGIRPSLTFEPSRWESIAKDRLTADAYGYVWGSAGTRETDDNNIDAFRKWGILPSRLASSGHPDLAATLFGEEYSYPIAMAPIGVLRIVHPEGERAAAAGAEAESVTYIMSTAAAMSLEEVAVANGNGSRWYQLYWPRNEHNDITASLLHRAKASGYRVLVVTLDTYILGWQPSDLDNGYNPFLHPDNIGVELGFSDPVFRKQFRERYGKEIEEDLQTAANEWTQIVFPGLIHGWEDLEFLRQHWDGPIVLKGIQTVADAKRAVDAGMQGIIVSNHGGRQQEGGIGSLDVLPEIFDAVGPKLDVLFDSGVRCGADIMKALALGAKMVLIGRPYVYGLAAEGQLGVQYVLKSLLGDLCLNLHLSGIPSVSQRHLNRDVLRRVR